MNSISVVVVIVLSCLSFGVSPSSGSRSLLRTISDNSDLPDVAVDLNSSNFDSVLRDTPANFAIVEFFAHWCPACRNYKPQYEKVARLFNGPNAVHPGIILMTRVDCADQINTKLCDKYSVRQYPMLLWGKPSKFTVGGWESGKDKSEVKAIDRGRTAVLLLDWINKQLGSSFSLDDEKYENEHVQMNSSDPEQYLNHLTKFNLYHKIARAVYDVEEATATAFEIILQHKVKMCSLNFVIFIILFMVILLSSCLWQMINAGTKASLTKFLQLIVAHHPSKRCRKGSAEMLMNFDELYPSHMWIDGKQKELSDDGKAALTNIQICGKEVPRGYWIFCRGSRNDTRGFSCGLWALMHSLSVRVEDGESHVAFTTICDFIHNFFICEECRQHFYKMCSSVNVPFNTTRDFSLWLWSAHNKVNERLKKDEASFRTADPKFPKILWPPKQLCPKCRLSTSDKSNEGNQITWDQDEVFKFLGTYYGKMLVSLYKDKDQSSKGGAAHSLSEDTTIATNALAVPLGAAFAIALASCAFGALACFWRSRQKNRKYRHNLRSFKDI
ncbi:hypothetical protein V2J09_015070 [Rumex salicifolius]